MQIEVYEWLKLQRQVGDDRFFSVREIEKGIASCGLFSGHIRGVWGAVVSLEAYGYLDVQKKGKLRDFRRVVRLKSEYVKKLSLVPASSKPVVKKAYHVMEGDEV